MKRTTQLWSKTWREKQNIYILWLYRIDVNMPFALSSLLELETPQRINWEDNSIVVNFVWPNKWFFSNLKQAQSLPCIKLRIRWEFQVLYFHPALKVLYVYNNQKKYNKIRPGFRKMDIFKKWARILLRVISVAY